MKKNRSNDDSNVAIFTNLSKSYGSIFALKNFTLSIRKGDFIALLGGNGAGKTTLIRILLGLCKQDDPPDGGSSFLFGFESSKLDRSVKERIGFISDDSCPPPWASGSSISKFYSNIYPKWDREIFVSLVKKWSLDANRKLNALSKGQKRLMEFALVLSHHPELLVMDEPFNGLDAVNRICLMNYIKELHAKRILTIIYTTHILEEVGKIADRIIIIRNGSKVFEGQSANMEDSIEKTFSDCYEIEQK